jgi:chromosomal replication initiation ATPase DnaA
LPPVPGQLRCAEHGLVVEKRASKQLANAPAMTPRARAMAEAVGALIEVSLSEILGNSHLARVVTARQLAMLGIRRFYVPEPSYPELGILFGRDHSTCISAVRRAQKMIVGKNAELYQAAMRAAQEAWEKATPWACEVGKAAE